jgi:phosphoribosyl-dephospho-CoA transferase
MIEASGGASTIQSGFKCFACSKLQREAQSETHLKPLRSFTLTVPSNSSTSDHSKALSFMGIGPVKDTFTEKGMSELSEHALANGTACMLD